MTLDGFKILDGQNGLNAGVATSGTISGYTIEDNVITNNTIGVYANCSGPSTIQNNLFDANNLPGPAGGAAIYSDAGTNGLVVRGNEFRNQTLNNPVIFGATAATSNTNLQFLDNSLHDNNFGVFALKVVHGLFEGNTISTTDPGGATALTIADGSSDVQVIHNVFQNNARGLRVMDFGFGVSSGPISGVVVHFNSFINNTQFGLFVDAGSYSGTVNAQNNFWGSPSGPTTPGNPGGTGNKVIGPVDSSAWLITPPGTATTLFWKDAAGNLLTVDTVTGDYAFFGADGTVVAGDGARVQKGVLKIHDHGTDDQKIDVSGPANGRVTVNLRGKNKKDFTLNSVPDPSLSV